ncbi:MAG: hypothetical protein V4560_17405 [Bacteroidota bacterium]
MKKQVVLTFLILVMSSFVYGQVVTAKDTITLYFNLTGIKYKKSESDGIAQIKTKRNVHIYTFTIPCNCIAGGAIGFDGFNNPETGLFFDPVKVIEAKVVKHLHFTSFNKLVEFMKAHQNRTSYKLYFIEKRDKKYYQYHVRMMGSFYEE